MYIWLYYVLCMPQLVNHCTGCISGQNTLNTPNLVLFHWVCTSATENQCAFMLKQIAATVSYAMTSPEALWSLPCTKPWWYNQLEGLETSSSRKGRFIREWDNSTSKQMTRSAHYDPHKAFLLGHNLAAYCSLNYRFSAKCISLKCKQDIFVM